MNELEKAVWAAAFAAYFERERAHAEDTAWAIDDISGVLCAEMADAALEKFRDAVAREDGKHLIPVKEKWCEIAPHRYPVRFITTYVGDDGEITAAKDFDLPIPPCVGFLLEDGPLSIEIKSGELSFDANSVVVLSDFEPAKLGHAVWLDVLKSNGWEVLESFPRGESPPPPPTRLIFDEYEPL